MIATATAVVAVLFLLGVLLYRRAEGHLPLGATPNVVLQTLTSGQKPLWGLANAMYAVYFLLLIPALWLAYSQMKDAHPAEAGVSFAAGVFALVTESFGRLWHTLVELPLVNAWQASDNPATQTSLANLLTRYDSYHQVLHYGAYAIVVWAVLMLIVALQRKSLPLWSGFLGFAMLPALGPFPPAALLWAMPMVVMSTGSKSSSKNSGSERASAGGRRRGGRRAALAGSRR